MPRGGLRNPPGGRPRGSRDKVPRATMATRVEADVREFLKTNNAAIFEGNSIALFLSVYKNENFPLALRLHAAALAAPYEAPRLVATANISKRVDGDDEAFGRLFQQIEAKLALQPPAARQMVIDMLREGEDEPI